MSTSNSEKPVVTVVVPVVEAAEMAQTAPPAREKIQPPPGYSPQVSRTIEPSDIESEPDTSEAPITSRIIQNTTPEATNTPRPAAGQPVRAQEFIPAQQRQVPAATRSTTLPATPTRLSEVTERASDDPEVVVRPNSTFNSQMGPNFYQFTKDKAVRVPRSVQEILARANRIYPG